MSQPADNPVTIAIWFEAIIELFNFQKDTQKAFKNFVRKLKTDPTLKGLNVEPLNGTKDRDIRSIRITRGCRAIVAKETKSNTYTILHLDEGHDDAYAWLSRRRIVANEFTNTMRLDTLPDPEQLSQMLSMGQNNGEYTDPFASFSDDDLTGFGVPSEGVFVLRSAPSQQAARMMSYLLTDQARACIDLALEGYGKDDITSLIADERKQGAAYGFSQASSSQEFIDAAGDNQEERTMRSMLTSNGTQQQFVVLTDDEDLERLMNAPLAQWRVFLHPTQRAVVNGDYSGPARVTGGAGTGKTVVAMHRARRLAQNLIRQGSSQKVLLTTYTVNLADDIRDNMALLCTKQELERIDIVNLDKWLSTFMKTHTKYRLEYKTSGLWQNAKTAISDSAVLGLPVDFFIQEWEQVILANDITTKEEYLAVPRRGRGERLTKAQRESVWTVVDRYRQLMDERRQYDYAYAMHVAADMLDGAYSDEKYAFIVVDEGQDFSAPAYRLLRSMVDRHDNDIFITSDNHQQLYGKRVSLRQCGIPIAGRSFRLKVNYRTTSEIKAVAETVSCAAGANTVDTVLQAMKEAKNVTSSVSVERVEDHKQQADDLDYSLNGVFDDSPQQESFGDGISLTHGEWPEAIRCKSWKAQFHQVTQWIDEKLSQDSSAKPEGMCVIVRDNIHVDDWVSALRSETTYGALRLDKSIKDTADTPGIRVATMYRAKGLEFDYVVVPDIDQCPPPNLVRRFADDANALSQLYQQERNLLYVAMTRPRKELLVTAVV
ncbi:UvrD-helicase domain-containing protein [Bifidobacterium leontopitheci]|uniref:DNA 3'-5' helicase n=1 Tax=Bifidobacterium leontopitheci TaxID=2650774 RepID=A0A6I1GK79_9BIFI|nr:UvrD-helicase domain-containing protein [Bifidobacterium leontopitheci]KAB7790046.1 UvrD-like helicase C-terminal domain-containing protein [Bifidobacterium leontopitheci]